MTGLAEEWAPRKFQEATAAQLAELLFLIDDPGMHRMNITVVLEWARGRPYPGGARKMIELIRQDIAHS